MHSVCVRALEIRALHGSVSRLFKGITNSNPICRHGTLSKVLKYVSLLSKLQGVHIKELLVFTDRKILIVLRHVRQMLHLD